MEIKKTLFFLTLFFTLSLSAQEKSGEEELSDEYKESDFQGEEENLSGLILKEKDLIGEVWALANGSVIWQYYSNKKLLMCNKDGKFRGTITELKWDVKGSIVNIYSLNNQLKYTFDFRGKTFDTVKVVFGDTEMDLYRTSIVSVLELCK